MSETPTVVQAISAVMDEVGAVPKGHRMEDGPARYQYRSIDDVLVKAQKAMVNHGVILLPSVQHAEYESIVSKRGSQLRQCTMHVAWRWYGPAGDYVESVTVGEAIDSSDKASNKAHTAAWKLALCEGLCIPFETNDPDHQHEERAVAVEWATPEQVGKVKALSAGLADEAKAAMRDFVERHGIDLKRMTTEQAALVLAELEQVSSPDGSGVVPPSTPEGSEVGEEQSVPRELPSDGEPGGPGQPAGAPSAAAREALKKVAKP